MIKEPRYPRIVRFANGNYGVEVRFRAFRSTESHKTWEELDAITAFCQFKTIESARKVYNEVNLYPVKDVE